MGCSAKESASSYPSIASHDRTQAKECPDADPERSTCTKEYIDAVRQLRCDSCHCTSDNPRTHPVAAPSPHLFSHELRIDVLKLQDDDLYLLLTYKFEPKEKNILDRKKIMGLDVGINRTISFYISDEKYQPRQLEIDNHIHHEVVKREKTRSKIKKSLSQCKGGHGLKRKTQAVLNSNKYNSSNWTKSKNHDISSAIIKIATKLGVGTIKMEDLTGITKNSKSFFMKSWAYDQLQQFIDYKAKSANIDVLWVDPKNTSNTCPTCKNSDPENRDDIDRTKFKCINPECEDFGKEKDADIVASQNITYKEGNVLKQKSKQGRIENSKKKKEIINNEINF